MRRNPPAPSRKPVKEYLPQCSQALTDDAWHLNRAKALEYNLLTMSLNRKIESIEVEHPEVLEALAVAESPREQTKALATLSMHQEPHCPRLRSHPRPTAPNPSRTPRAGRELAEASRAYQNHARRRKLPFVPSEYGFVLPIAEIEAACQANPISSPTAEHVTIDRGEKPSDKEKNMNRRRFGIALGTVVAGLIAGAALQAQDENPKPDKKTKKEKHDCKGMNSCKGKGGCKTGDNGCAGKNSCKGKGGCAVPAEDRPPGLSHAV
jgi:hypothetical protein